MSNTEKVFRNVLLLVFLMLVCFSLFISHFNDQPGYEKSIIENIKNKELPKISKIKNNKYDSSLKYILQWTSSNSVPFVYMGSGRQVFIDNKCEFTNCFVTSDRKYIWDYTHFDVIAFNGPVVASNLRERQQRYIDVSFPKKRSLDQKFVFASIESADNYPVCMNILDNYFNWTWTFRLDSESRWGYIVVRDADNKIIGPNKIMHWIDINKMKPIPSDLRIKLKSKTKAVAWFVSNCETAAKRTYYALDLDLHLQKYNLSVDLYGRCGKLKCERGHEECNEIISRDYYFYLAFENSYDEDYVTEKLLHGLKNNAVPIVYGGANYTRFMPNGIYLNARQMDPSEMADKIYSLISNFEDYVKFFKWKSHYSYYRRVESPETNDYCGFCAMLNKKELVEQVSVYKDFRKWWTPPGRC